MGWINVGSKATDDVTFIDTGLTLNTLFFYRDFTRTSHGGDSVESNVVMNMTMPVELMEFSID